MSMTQRSAECPAPDCGFSDVPSLVAAHVNGTEGPEHDWARLPYDGPKEFLSEARGGSDGREDGTDGDGPTAATEIDDRGDDPTDSDPADPADPADSADREDDFDPSAAFRAAEVARDRASGVDDPSALDTEDLVDLYVAFSVLSGEASSVRGDLKSVIVDRIREEGEIAGDLGSVSRSTATRRSLRDEGTVRSALFAAGIDPREAETFDPSRVADLIEDADVDEAAVFETSESDRLRRSGVNEDAFEGG